jgi:hypothetical protein
MGFRQRRLAPSQGARIEVGWTSAPARAVRPNGHLERCALGGLSAMPPLPAALLFVASLAVTLVAARLFARRLDRLGFRFGFPEALVGLLTALAADGPEVTSALVALAKGAHNVSVGACSSAPTCSTWRR